MDEAKRHDILLKEYAEAGTLCRSIEQLTRSSLALFLPSATVIAGLVATPTLPHEVRLAVAVAGVFYALLLANTVLRSRAYYVVYVERAKCIESLIQHEGAPVMRLYTSGSEVSGSTWTMSNKYAIAAVFIVAAAFFGGAAVFSACHVFYGAP